jgi:hypothetical protein
MACRFLLANVQREAGGEKKKGRRVVLHVDQVFDDQVFHLKNMPAVALPAAADLATLTSYPPADLSKRLLADLESNSETYEALLFLVDSEECLLRHIYILTRCGKRFSPPSLPNETFRKLLREAREASAPEKWTARQRDVRGQYFKVVFREGTLWTVSHGHMGLRPVLPLLLATVFNATVEMLEKEGLLNARVVVWNAERRREMSRDFSSTRGQRHYVRTGHVKPTPHHVS